MADFPKPKQTTNFRGNFQKRKINSDYSLKKRPPKKHSHHENAVYVTTKSDIKVRVLLHVFDVLLNEVMFQSLMKKCENLFNKNVNEIVIYAVGAAIERGINLALQFTEKYPSYKTEVNTTTISLIGK